MKWNVARDILLFLGGLAGVAHETLLQHSDRPTLLILFAAMMGLPAFLQSEVHPRWAPGKQSEGEPQPKVDVVTEQRDDAEPQPTQQENASRQVKS